MKEEWKDIPGYEGLYQISNLGRVKSLARKVKTKNGNYQGYNEKILKTRKKGYCIVSLCKDRKIKGMQVHRLVAEAFIPNPENKPYVDHIDTNPQNNNVNNLRWCTQKENCLNPISRKNNSLSKMGHKGYLKQHSEETKLKLSLLKKGKKLSEEHKKRLSESHMGIAKGRNTCMKGKHWRKEGGKRIWY